MSVFIENFNEKTRELENHVKKLYDVGIFHPESIVTIVMDQEALSRQRNIIENISSMSQWLYTRTSDIDVEEGSALLEERTHAFMNSNEYLYSEIISYMRDVDKFIELTLRLLK